MHHDSATEIELLQFHPSLEYLEYVGQRSLYAETLLDHTSSFLRLNNLGAFVKYETGGINKSISLSHHDLLLKNICDESIGDYVSNNRYFFFPQSIRNELTEFISKPKRILYQLSKENPQCATWTHLGYFLAKKIFNYWKKIVEDVNHNLKKFLREEIGKDQYETYYVSAFQLFNKLYGEKNEHLKKISSFKKDNNDIEHIKNLYHSINIVIQNISQLKKQLTINDFDNPEEKSIFKMHHIPPSFEDFVSQIYVSTYFFTIHPENLCDYKIESIEDVKYIIEKIWHPKPIDFC